MLGRERKRCYYINNQLSDIEGIRQWQAVGYTEDIATQLYNFANEYSVNASNLMAIMSDIFISKRDVESFLNAILQNVNSKPDIPQLKKRIKYCRNPLEKKKLQQELNMAYKERKRCVDGKR